MAKEERNLKILEDKLKAHEDNIHVLKSELAEGEKELEVKKSLPFLSKSRFVFLRHFLAALQSEMQIENRK